MRWSGLTEVIGMSAVILSLVFVGIEIRDNTAATKAQALLDFSSAANDLGLAVIEDDEFAEILIAGDADSEELTESNKARYRRYVFAMLNIYENAFIFNAEGLLDKNRMVLGQITLAFCWLNPGSILFGRTTGLCSMRSLGISLRADATGHLPVTRNISTDDLWLSLAE
jgi:hypothetical protein